MSLQVVLWHLISGPQIPWKEPFQHCRFLENACVPLSLYGEQHHLSLPSHWIVIGFGCEGDASSPVLSEELPGLGPCWNGAGLNYTLILLIAKCIESCLTNHHLVLPVVVESLSRERSSPNNYRMLMENETISLFDFKIYFNVVKLELI